MANIAINQGVWNAVSPAEKTQISEHLMKHKVLKEGDVITGNQQAVAGIFDDLNPGKLLCQIGCDAAAAAAIAALTLSGPALAAAIAAIGVAHDACRNSC